MHTIYSDVYPPLFSIVIIFQTPAFQDKHLKVTDQTINHLSSTTDALPIEKKYKITYKNMIVPDFRKAQQI